ncbi:carbonic anhydrase 1-like [Sycon ciliatum]|eukprot:scpid52059/ scgid34338/ Carbonic anhydrase 1; Carbonate dehydratase I; Carbonic anhydrase I
MKFIIFMSLAVSCSQVASQSWNYDPSSNIGPANWGNIPGFETCGTGTEQSPINIPTASAMYASYPPLNITSNATTDVYHLENVGDAPTGFAYGSSNTWFTGGPVGVTHYKLHSFHLHYGNSTYDGSEHAIDGMRTSAELDVVFYNGSYQNLNQALASGDRDAIAIIAVLFSPSDDISHAHPGVTPLLNFFSQLTYRGDQSAEQLNFQDILRPEDITTFYTYYGSNSHPACNEQVVWMVMSQIQYYPPTMINALSGLLSSNRSEPRVEQIGNTRPLQPLNSRMIFQNFHTESSGSGLMTVSLVALLLSFLAASF